MWFCGFVFLLLFRMRKKDRLEFEKQENGVPPAFAKPGNSDDVCLTSIF